MIKYNEVTWYSKLAALILFLIILPGLAFCAGIRYQQIETMNNVVVAEPAPKTIVTETPKLTIPETETAVEDTEAVTPETQNQQ